MQNRLLDRAKGSEKMTPKEFASQVGQLGDLYAKVGTHVIHVYETSNRSHHGDHKLIEIGLNHPALHFYDVSMSSDDRIKLFFLVSDFMSDFTKRK